MNLDRLLETIDRQLIDNQDRPLHATEVLILRGNWQFKTYNQIALEADYSPGYFTTVVAPELYQRLSQLIGQRVTKKNCRSLLESYVATNQATSATKTWKQDVDKSLQIKQDALPCYPSGSVPLDSPFYLERFAVEEQVEREIRKPGALIRIKAPREMGKTSLLVIFIVGFTTTKRLVLKILFCSFNKIASILLFRSVSPIFMASSRVRIESFVFLFPLKLISSIIKK